MSIIFLILLIPYLVPGLWLARGMYGEQMRAIRSSPIEVMSIPTKPERPEITMMEMLHATKPRKCNSIDASNGTRTCNCLHRSEWVSLKNAWADYNEWDEKYGHLDPTKITNKQPHPKMLPIYSAVPLWPLFAMAMYVKGGAKNIPDFRDIERLEHEAGIKALDS